MRLYAVPCLLIASARAVNLNDFSLLEASQASESKSKGFGFGFGLQWFNWLPSFFVNTNTATSKEERGEFAPDECKCLNQSDFENGTFIIDAPGDYKLCEDISFSPLRPPPGKLPEDACDPIFPSLYDENAYGLGFFAAIAITAPDVKLYLNNHTIEQGADHALLQRFFAVIELAGAPFIRSAGPAQFVGEGRQLMSSSNTLIAGPGTIGLSSHHGIHGNNNLNVEIRDVTFRDFEVAAVSLNKVQNLVITGCDIQRNRHDLPVLGMFSAARFLRPYGKMLKMKNYTMTLRGQETTAAEVYDNLLKSIENVFMDVMSFGYIDKVAHPIEYELFDNVKRFIEGPCYAFLVHGHGPAVGDQGHIFGAPNVTSYNITIEKNNISNIHCWTNEVPAAVVDNAVMTDARGSVFQFVRPYDGKRISINEDGTYKGNVVADMQIMVAKAIADGIIYDVPLHQTKTNTIEQTLINWASSATEVYKPQYRCSGDSMHHVNKGVIIFRIENTQGVNIRNNNINNVENQSPPPFSDCYDLHAGINDENEGEQQGANVRAISVAAIRRHEDGKLSTVNSNRISNLKSVNANVVIGIDVQGDSSGVEISNNFVNVASDIGHDRNDTCYAMRLRQNATDIIIRSNNKFFQDILRQNRRRLNEPRRIAVAKVDVDGTEYRLGGCPFAHMVGTRFSPH